MSSILNDMQNKKLTPINKNNDAELARVAELYYVENKHQDEIAKALKTTQADVSKCLRLAKERKIVEISVKSPRAEALDSRVKEAFPHLSDVRIVSLAGLDQRSPEMFASKLGLEGARFLSEKLRAGASLGVSCGQMTAAVIQGIRKLREEEGVRFPGNCSVYPLLTFMMPDIFPVSPIVTAINLLRWLPESRGKGFHLPTPKQIESDGCTLKAYQRDAEVCQLLEEIKTLDWYLIGIGFLDYQGRMQSFPGSNTPPTHEFNSLCGRFHLQDALRSDGAVGESVYQPFDKDGNSLIDRKGYEPLKSIMFFLRLQELVQHVKNNTATVVAVTGGKEKYEAILAALRGRLFNVLITDEGTAQFLLDSAEQSKKRPLTVRQHKKKSVRRV